jgi:lipid II:glycine glycyltransferase (peptidoglycan interpeptide bridge formation enzyme)
MQAVFKSELDNTDLENIGKFCNSVDYCSIEQSVGWTEMSYKTRICYFFLIDNTDINSFSLISQNFKFAHIDFGPVCCDKELMITSINEIINYYKKKGFFSLDIQMYYKSGYDTEYIEYSLNKLHNIKYKFNNENTKSSVEIDLTRSMEEIYSNIRKGHKSDIKRATKLGLTVDKVKNKDELDSFFDIYSKMCKSRNIDLGELSSKNINEIYNYLIKNNKGKILIVKDKDNSILGGVVLVYQGISVRYFKGASDPERRDLPITHLALYEAIKESKNENFKYFDFWGYNHFANENDHVYHINHFKKGFGGYYTFFAKKMNINLVPNGYNFYRSLLHMKNIFRKIEFN